MRDPIYMYTYTWTSDNTYKIIYRAPRVFACTCIIIQVTQINTSTTLCSSRKRIKYLCIFRYLNGGLTTCTESSYWRFKKWVHVIDHKQSYISKDVEEMLRVHERDGGGGGGWGTKIFLHYRRPTCSKLCFFKSNNHQMGLFSIFQNNINVRCTWRMHRYRDPSNKCTCIYCGKKIEHDKYH